MSTPHLLCLFISSHYVWTTRHGPCKHHVLWASLEISPHFFKAALVFHVLGTIYVSAEVHRHRVYFFLTISRFCFMCQWPWDSEQFAGSWGCAGLLIHCWSLNSLCCWKWGDCSLRPLCSPMKLGLPLGTLFIDSRGFALWALTLELLGAAASRGHAASCPLQPMLLTLRGLQSAAWCLRQMSRWLERSSNYSIHRISAKRSRAKRSNLSRHI